MRRELSPAQQSLANEVDAVLYRAVQASGHRELFAMLGSEKLLAVHYPRRYGGRGLSLSEQAAVAEAIGMRGLPDVVHLVTVHAVGGAILAFGSSPQRSRWLPEIAAGRLFASLLLSEPGAGSDLTRIETMAEPSGDSWILTGTKTWSLHTDWSDLALCSVRTSDGVGSGRYGGISLFLVELAAPGVKLIEVPRLASPPYFQVDLREVRVDAGALIGPLHRGWPLLPTIIGFERWGFDYLSRGRLWLRTAAAECGRLPERAAAAMKADLVRLGQALDNARAVAFHAAYHADGLDMDEIVVAYAKLACGRAAQSVAHWIGQELLPALGGQIDGAAAVTLQAAVAEAPELTISGGPVDLQLDLIASEFPIGRALR